MDRADIPQLSSTSVIGFGCGGLGARLSMHESLRLLEAAADGGINYIDVARAYGYGRAESVVGRLLHHHRDRFFVVSKAGVKPPAMSTRRRLAVNVARPVVRMIPMARRAVSARANASVSTGVSVAELAQSLDESLTALRTDYLDVLMLHELTAADLTDEVRYWADGVVAEGKARAWGVATTARDVGEILRAEPSFTPFAPFSPAAVNLPSSASEPQLDLLRIPGPRLRAVHSVLGHDLGLILRYLTGPGADAGWADRLGIPVSSGALATLLLQVARARNPLGVVLAGTQTLAHVPALVAAGAGLPAPEQVFAVGELVAAARAAEFALV